MGEPEMGVEGVHEGAGSEVEDSREGARSEVEGNSLKLGGGG